MKIFLIVAGLLISTHTVGQTLSDTTELYTEIAKLQQVYKEHALSFDIRYTYSSELHPAKILDSLIGSMELAGSTYHYKLDNRETFSNNHYSLILFKEDKVMYIAKPVESSNTGNPIPQLRQMMGNDNIKSCGLVNKGNLEIFKINFKAEDYCREMEITIEKSTGYLLSMKYIVKTELLMEALGNPNTTTNSEYGPYAIVESDFNNYKLLKPDVVLFNEQDFFSREENVFKTTSAYSSYKIFAGSPNL
jgi:hypothetical protein